MMILLGELNLSALVIIVLKFESFVYNGLKFESLLYTMDSNLSPFVYNRLKFESIVEYFVFRRLSSLSPGFSIILLCIIA